MSTPKPPSDSASRDTAILADVLNALHRQLVDGDRELTPTTPEVDAIVASALAELQRIGMSTERLAGVAPVLGTGVLQELLRRSRDTATPPAGLDVTPHVDFRR
jgi:hypothetical protein